MVRSAWVVNKAGKNSAAYSADYDPEAERENSASTDWSLYQSEPPHLNWSSAMFRKRRTDNDEQTTEAGRDYHEVEAS